MNLNNKIINYIINSSNKIKINSQDIKKNDIFIALKGKKYHGNKFINQAFDAGAKFCITDKKFKQINKTENILFVPNIFSFLKILSKHKRSLFTGEVIGITGSAGKTTLKEYLNFFLIKKYKVSTSIKSYNNSLGVMISILNININSNFAIFEIGTNDFNEIRDLTKLVQPSQIFITNILSTHLEKFKNKNNIAREKSDIFNKKYNSKAQTLFFQMNSNAEIIIRDNAKKHNIKNVIKTGQSGLDCYIKHIKKNKSYYKVDLQILKKQFSIVVNKYEENQIKNIIFVLAFFIINKMNTKIIIENINKLPQVEGRGSFHKIAINGINIYLIDQSYNANPETMIQSIINFSKFQRRGFQKILILGDMNELGLEEVKYHSKVLELTNEFMFDRVILSGDLFKKALSILRKFKSKYVYRKKSHSIMSYLNKNIHKKAIIMAKCSNATEVNKLIKLIKQKKKDKIV